MPDTDPDPQPESEPEQAEAAEPAAPLNRAERRAQQRGKQSPRPAHDGFGPSPKRRDEVLAPRRAGRRGNR